MNKFTEVIMIYLQLVLAMLTKIYERPMDTPSTNVLQWLNRINDRILDKYHKVSNIRCSQFQNLSDSRPALQLSLPNLLKSCIKSRMKM